MFDLKERIVMVTGPAGNLGRAAAEKLLSAGARLILVDRAADRLASVYPSLAGSSEHHLANGVDVSDLDSVESMVSQVMAKFGRIDGLVNTVGAFRFASPLEEACLDQWDMMMRVNAYSTLVTCRSVIPHMVRSGGGSVVNVGSRLALRGTARTAAYSAAKSAVLRLTESLSEEVKASGVKVNCVLPGTLDTPANRDANPDADYSSWTPPEEVADVILFLLSDRSNSIHGAAIPVYGLS